MENNKSRFWKGVLVGSLVTAFAGLIIVGMSAGIFLIGQTVIDNQIQTQRASGSVNSNKSKDGLEIDRISAKMKQIQQMISQYYLFDEDTKQVEDGVYMGLMYGLNDPYSVYYNKESYQAMQEDTSGIYSGIGAMVSQNPTTGVMTISKVFKGAPAYEAGMLPGDILYEVGDTSIVGMDLQLVISDHIRGEDGSFVKIKVLRGENNDEVELNVERRKIEVPTVEHQMLEDQVGYIYVMQFDTITSSQFCSAVDDLESQGMKKLIIDLRDNPGGALDSVVEMLAYILPEDKMDGLLLYTADKEGKGEKYFCKDGQLQQSSDHGLAIPGYPKADGHEVKLPMVVLVNGHSASASEVFVGAIQDYDWGTVVGTQTFGKGIVQNLIPLGDDTAIKLTTSHYYTPSGFDLHKVGLTPDTIVELNEDLKTKAVVSLQEDNQVQAALKILTEP